ncbi:MAG TPA: DUF6766 family protein [Flavobacteriaceae bacterium]|nr:DUF6766 family protein [Flavobacteriaceae bacterium]
MKTEEKSESRSFWYRNALSLVFLSLFLITWAAQAYSGWLDYDSELKDKFNQHIDFQEYVKSGHFISATFENFESEFLQMALFVLLTVSLRQQGSPQSKPLNREDETEKEPVPKENAPWPVKKGGWILKIYENSLSITFAILFLLSWGIHFYGSLREHNVEQILLGKPAYSVWQYLGKPGFWFETFQNWQSEFLSVFSIVFLSIFLRQKGSPESKPVDAPYVETGK